MSGMNFLKITGSAEDTEISSKGRLFRAFRVFRAFLGLQYQIEFFLGLQYQIEFFLGL
jgi:hypothetical protein